MLGCPLLVFWLESGFDILGKKKFPMFKDAKQEEAQKENKKKKYGDRMLLGLKMKRREKEKYTKIHINQKLIKTRRWRTKLLLNIKENRKSELEKGVAIILKQS